MCGIAGFVTERLDPGDRIAVLDRMVDSIAHRGPDDVGTLIDDPLAMGMRRLSILDLSGGRQPMWDHSGRYGVVFNGEIYNYRELRQDLVGRTGAFKTDSDTEVIPHLFAAYGKECLQKLRGMFAFAVWDNQRRELFLARDRLGIKPLYFTQMSGDFVFASEIKALLRYPGVHARLDLEALSKYLSLKYVPAPRTLFTGIHSLSPGHCLTVRGGRVEIREYWDIACAPTDRCDSVGEYTERLESLLRESVRLRLRSDVPFGAFLSGGVDSSLIVALMSDMLDRPVRTFSVGFSGSKHGDELPYARQVADRFGCDHREIVVGAADFAAHAEEVLWHLDQPIADQATVATHMVAKLASNHVKMVLTGEGGDELFAGYARYVGERYSRWFARLPSFLGSGIRGMLPLIPGLMRPKTALHALTHRDEADRFAQWFPLFNDDSKRKVLSVDLRSSLCGNSVASAFAEQLARCDSREALQRMLYVDTKLWLPDYLLLRGDKLTMANSLEARVPLLDHKVVEFAARLPKEMKLHGMTRKYLLKRVARRLLPDAIVDRKKQGFPIPIAEWFRNELRPMVRDLLTPRAIQQRGLFNAAYVDRLLREHDSRFADHSNLIWGLMSVELWQRQFTDTGPVETLC